MTNKIIGNLDVTGSLKLNGKVVGTSLSLSNSNKMYTADASGHLEIPVPKKSDVDYILKQLPLSQYGSVSNLPVGVGGTFDGGSTVAYYSAMPVLLENDGTLTYLRPGTNGSSINYYYTYIGDPNVSTKPINSVRKYYNGSSKNIIFFDSYAKDTLIYQDIENSLLYVVLTNGTLDNSQHQQASIARSTIPYPILNAFKVNNDVYILTLYVSTYNVNSPTGITYKITDPFQFVFYKIPVAEIESGTINTVEQISSVTGTTMYGEDNHGNIRIADVWASTNDTSTNSFIKYPSGINLYPYRYSTIGSSKAYYDGNNITFSFAINTVGVNSTGTAGTMYGFNVLYNVSDNSYTTDLSSSPLVCNGTTSGVLTWNNPYNINSSKTHGIGTSNGDSQNYTSYITDSGVQYAIKEKYVLSDFYSVSRATITNYTTKIESYQIRNRVLNLTSSSNIYSDFASRVGDQLVGGSPISTTSIMFTGTGTYEGTTYTNSFRGIADIGTTPNYTYNSVDRGTITGYPPQSKRVPFGTTNESKIYSKLSYCDESGNVESYGTAFVETSYLSTGYQFSASTLSYDKNVSINNSTLTDLKNTILTQEGIDASVTSRIALYYSPKNDYCKSIAYVCVYFGSGLGGKHFFATVDCTMSGNTVDSAILDKVFYTGTQSNATGISPGGYTVGKSGLSCVKFSDFTYISFSALLYFSVPGGSTQYTGCAIVNTDKSISSVIVGTTSGTSGSGGLGREYSYIPNLGFGYYVYNNTDKGTKLIFKNCGNTLSQFNSNMASGVGTDTVIIAQDVINGFYLYFTERTPLFISGQYFEMPITSIDLSTIKSNPANTTYYVYVKLQYGTPEYVVSLSELTENNTTIFIGTVNTDGTKISDLNIFKVSKFDNYRPSSTQIGGAFPISTGNPLDSGNITW